MSDLLRIITFACLLVVAAVPTQAQPAQAPLAPNDVFKRASPAVVTLTAGSIQGSGVIIDPSGVIVTNLHVVSGANRVAVRVANGDTFDNVTVIEFDARRDLVLLKITGFRLPVAELGDSDSLAIGNRVFAVGAPKGLELSLTDGVVSGLRDSGEGYRVIQTSAAISPGSSGGGLFDDHGRLIGITTFKIRGGENLNFALPINYVRGMLASPPKQLSLADLATQVKGAVSETTQPSANASGVPMLAPVYRTLDALAVIEQNGERVRVSFTRGAYVYGSADLVWDSNGKHFRGNGTLDTRCGQVDTRIWKAPVQVEIHIVNGSLMRERWTQPTRVNCTRGRVNSSVWQEAFWYRPTD